MSHDTHNGHSKENKTIISFKNSFWLVVILVGLFIAALNFVQAESKGEEGEGHHEGTHTEATHEGHESAAHESHEGDKKTDANGEASLHENAPAAPQAPSVDTAHHAAH